MHPIYFTFPGGSQSTWHHVARGGRPPWGSQERLCSWDDIPDPATQFRVQPAWWSDLYQTYRERICKLAHLSLSTVKQKLPLGLYTWGSRHSLFSPNLKSQLSVVMMEAEKPVRIMTGAGIEQCHQTVEKMSHPPAFRITFSFAT